jgi:hypothetical protein
MEGYVMTVGFVAENPILGYSACRGDTPFYNKKLDDHTRNFTISVLSQLVFGEQLEQIQNELRNRELTNYSEFFSAEKLNITGITQHQIDKEIIKTINNILINSGKGKSSNTNLKDDPVINDILEKVKNSNNNIQNIIEKSLDLNQIGIVVKQNISRSLDALLCTLSSDSPNTSDFSVIKRLDPYAGTQNDNLEYRENHNTLKEDNTSNIDSVGFAFAHRPIYISNGEANKVSITVLVDIIISSSYGMEYTAEVLEQVIDEAITVDPEDHLLEIDKYETRWKRFAEMLDDPTLTDEQSESLWEIMSDIEKEIVNIKTKLELSSVIDYQNLYSKIDEINREIAMLDLGSESYVIDLEILSNLKKLLEQFIERKIYHDSKNDVQRTVQSNETVFIGPYGPVDADGNLTSLQSFVNFLNSHGQSVSSTDFANIEGIDDDGAKKIKTYLKSQGILSEHNMLVLDKLDDKIANLGKCTVDTFRMINGITNPEALALIDKLKEHGVLDEENNITIETSELDALILTPELEKFRSEIIAILSENIIVKQFQSDISTVLLDNKIMRNHHSDYLLNGFRNTFNTGNILEDKNEEYLGLINNILELLHKQLSFLEDSNNLNKKKLFENFQSLYIDLINSTSGLSTVSFNSGGGIYSIPYAHQDSLPNLEQSQINVEAFNLLSSWEHLNQLFPDNNNEQLLAAFDSIENILKKIFYD